MHAQHLEHISIGDVEGVVNNQAAAPYSRTEVMLLLEVMVTIRFRPRKKVSRSSFSK